MKGSAHSAEKVDSQIDQCQATFDRRYKLLELKERREDRALKRQELELSQGRGIKFTSSQATVAGATLALLSAIIGGLIQSVATRDVEAGKNRAQIAIEELKVRGNIDLEKQKQDAAERLDRAKFETTLILKATEASRREDQIRNLKFFLTAGFIRDPDNKIANMSEAAYPSSPPPTVEKVKTPADIYSASKGSVGLVTISGELVGGNKMQNVGTCFVVSKDGYALTAAHHFPPEIDRRTMQISIALGAIGAPRMPAELVKIDQEADIALIKMSNNTGYSPIGISREQPQVADPIFVIGFPVQLDTVLLSGVVSSLNEGGGKIGLSASLMVGMSGSPVFGKNGDVVAMAIGNRRSDAAYGVVIPINFARSMLTSIGLQ